MFSKGESRTQVANGAESLKEWGPLVLTMHSHEGVSGLWFKVGTTEWCVDPTMPTLEASDNTFMFAMPGGRFLSVLLAAGTSPLSSPLHPFLQVLCFRYLLNPCPAATDIVMGWQFVAIRDRRSLKNVC
jgi:hypothetical protein